MTNPKRDHPPPSAPECEVGLLYLFLSDSESAEVIDSLPGEAINGNIPLFNDPLRQSGFQAIRELRADGGTINVHLLIDRMVRGGINLMDATIAISQWGETPCYDGAKEMSERLVECWRVRAALAESERFKANLLSGVNPKEAFVSHEQALSKIRDEGGECGEFRSIKVVTADAMDEIEAVADGRQSIRAIKTGFGFIDAMTGGFRPSEQIIIAARPGDGKSALLAAMALNIAERGNRVALFTAEMDDCEVNTRMISMMSKVPLARLIGNDRISRQELDEVRRVSETISKLPIDFNDSASLTVAQIESKIRKMNNDGRGPVVVLGVDYVQLMSSEGRYDNRNSELAEISRKFKILAQSTGLIVILLSQLTRPKVEVKRSDPKPMPGLQELRDSGALESDANKVIFVRQIENKLRHTFLRVRIGKQRNGKIGDGFMNFNGDCTLPYDLSESQRSEMDRLI